MKSFLDLPAEIRNIIYKLVSDSSVKLWPQGYDSRRHYPLLGMFFKYNQPNYIRIPAIATTCRQIRGEFISQELPRYKVDVHDIALAHHWDHLVDEIFTTHIRNLTFRICLKSHVSDKAGARERKRMSRLSFFPILQAEYREGSDFKPIMRLDFEDRNERNINLDQPSRNAVRRVLSALLSSDIPLNVRAFVEAVSTISEMTLYHREVENPDPDPYCWVRGVRAVFTINKVPRSLHEEERGLWFGMSTEPNFYERNVADILEEPVMTRSMSRGVQNVLRKAI